MNKIFITALIILGSAMTINAQSVTLSDVSLSLGMGTGNYMSMTVNCKINSPEEGTRIVVLTGSDKDQKEAGIVSGIFVKEDNQLKILPSSIVFKDGIVSIPFSADGRNIKYLTLFIEDTKGVVVSNKLYYKMP